MRIASLLLLASSFTLACSTAEQNAETATLSGGSAGSSTGDPSGSGTTGASSQTDSGTTAQGSAGTEGTTGSATTGLGPTVTGTSGIDTTTGITSDTDPMTGTTTGTSTGTTGTSTDTGTTTGGMSGGPCEVDADCKLHDDCCSCYAIPVDQDDGECEKACDQTKCAEIGIDQAVCRFGQCVLEKVDCSSPVVCDSLPPDCAQGTLPSIENGCWTGKCVPAEACDKVPDCGLCPDSMMCVEYQAWMIDKTCEPIPAGCDGAPTCECAGADACVEPFGVCNEGKDDTDLICICIAC